MKGGGVGQMEDSRGRDLLCQIIQAKQRRAADQPIRTAPSPCFSPSFSRQTNMSVCPVRDEDTETSARLHVPHSTPTSTPARGPSSGAMKLT